MSEVDGQWLHSLVDRAAQARPEAVAVRDEHGAWSYAQLADQSLRLAQRLRRKGVGHGDRLLLRLANRREQVAAVFAASRLGAIAVPVSRDLKPFLLADLIADAAPALIIGEGDDADRLSGLSACPVCDVGSLWAKLAAEPPIADRTGDFAIPSDPCLMIYTSGTTSRPKAVVSSHAQVRFATSAIAQRLGYRCDDVIFVRSPLSFDYGLYQVFLAALSQAAVVFADSRPDFTLHQQIRSCAATIVPVVPTIAATLVTLAGRARDDAGQHAVRLFTNTGAALSPQAIDQLRRAYPGAAVCLMFGITECKRVSILEPDGDLARPHSVGRPLPGTRVQILSDEGVALPAGEVGELVVRGPHVMTGYWQAPELTAMRFRPDPRTGERRLHTGDYGYLDADGYLYFVGRRDDIIKRRGMRVSLLEVEHAASRVPGVSQCVASHRAAVDQLILHVTGQVDPDEVIRHLARWLEPARLPDACFVVGQLPTTPNGKVDRVAARAMEGGGRDD